MKATAITAIEKLTMGGVPVRYLPTTRNTDGEIAPSVSTNLQHLNSGETILVTLKDQVTIQDVTALAAEYLDTSADRTVEYVSTQRLAQELATTFSHSASVAAKASESAEDTIRMAKASGLLILDGLDVLDAHSHSIRLRVLELVEFRYSHQLPTVITSECGVRELDIRYGSRFAATLTAAATESRNLRLV